MSKVYQLYVNENYLDAMAYVMHENGNNFLALNKRFINEFGLVKASMLAKFIEFNRYVWNMSLEKRISFVRRFGKHAVILIQNGFFYLKIDDISEELMVGNDLIRKIINELNNRNILEVKKAGNPARNFYKLNFFILEEILKSPKKNKKPSDCNKKHSVDVNSKQKRTSDGRFSSKIEDKNVI